jgi:hypothetical protein
MNVKLTILEYENKWKNGCMLFVILRNEVKIGGSKKEKRVGGNKRKKECRKERRKERWIKGRKEGIREGAKYKMK